MRIKLPEFQVHKDNPFADDALQRGESAEVLTRLILTLNEPFVLAVDSPWGTGKTTFLKMWAQQLSNAGYPCLFFNAWETDYNNDALIALMGEVEIGIGNINISQKQKTRAKQQFTKAKKLGVALAKRSIPTAIKIATAGLLDASTIANQSAAELAEQIAKEELDKYEVRKNTIQKFKQKLSAFISELADQTNNEDHKPLIFFIDELDRCRPTYALEVLEKAKHLFNVNGIIFVLAIDKEQIGHSIRSVYGAGMDMDGYLRRFIDMDYRLPELDIGAYCAVLFEKFGFKQYFENRKTREAPYEVEQFMSIFIGLATAFRFSLRTIEQCFSRLNIVFRTTPEDHFMFPIYLAALIALRAAKPVLYRDYINRRADAEKVLEFFKETPFGTSVLTGTYGAVLETFLVAGPWEWRDKDSVRAKYANIFQSKDAPVSLRNRAENILQVLDRSAGREIYGVLSHLVKRIEITDQFVLDR